MTYPETAAEYARALRGFPAPNLPVSALAQGRRETLSPVRLAANHADHVRGAAAALRDALIPMEQDIAMWEGEDEQLINAYNTARALLTEIGEGEA